MFFFRQYYNNITLMLFMRPRIADYNFLFVAGQKKLSGKWEHEIVALLMSYPVIPSIWERKLFSAI